MPATTAEIAQRGLILRGTVGSTAGGRRDYSMGTSRLPEKADRQRLDELLVEIYTGVWKELW